MTYNVFSGTLNAAQSQSKHKGSVSPVEDHEMMSPVLDFPLFGSVLLTYLQCCDIVGWLQ